MNTKNSPKKHSSQQIISYFKKGAYLQCKFSIRSKKGVHTLHTHANALALVLQLQKPHTVVS